MSELTKWIAGTMLSAMCLTAPAIHADSETKTVWALQTGQLDNSNPVTGIVNYPLDSPSSLTMIHEISNGNSLGAGVMVDGIYYWFEYKQQVYGYDSVGLFSYDTENGSVKLIKSYNDERMGICFSSPTYDYQTKTVYALDGLMDGFSLVSVDLETGNVTRIITFSGLIKNMKYDMDDSLKAIALNYDGEMYGVSYWGRLYRINKVSGECTMVADLDFNPEEAIMYHTSLAFDNDTNDLYWRVYTWINRYDEVRKINIHDGTSVQMGFFENGILTGDFHIPFTVAAPSAPAKVNDYEAIPDPEGGLGITLSWTNPTKTYGRGGTLESLEKVEIYRNNKLIKTFDNPGIGSTMTYHDEVDSSDLYAYKIIGINEAGNGDRSVKTVFVGQGIPMPVTDITLVSEGHGAKLSWKAPTHGKFDAYLDLSSLTFEITRSDGVTVATECRDTEFTDNTIETLARYSYTVKARNIGGESLEIQTDAVVCGPAIALPTTFTFADENEFSLWETIDGNGDETSWTYSTWPMTGAKSSYSYLYEYAAHDYLISPKVTMETGKHYKLIFDALPSNKNITEIVAISFGKEANVQMQDSVTQFEFRSNGPRTLRASLPAVSEDGDYCFGFLHRSTESEFELTVGNISVEEDHDGNISGRISCGSRPVADAVIKSSDSLYSTRTDSEGQYILEYLPQGNHTLLVSAIGYADFTTDVEVKELETVSADIQLTALPEHTLSGKVIDSEGEAVTDAVIRVGGYNAYTAYTENDGSFEIPGIFAHEGYSIVIERNNLMSHSQTIDIYEDIDLGTITLSDNAKAPQKARVSESESGNEAEVEWLAPLGDPREIRYDDGTVTKSLGVQSGTGNTILGNINRVPSVVYGCSFYIMSRVDIPEHYGVGLYVIGLDENGNPGNDVLFYDSYVPVTDDQWTSYTFPSPIDCPNGYVVGVSYYGFVSLAVDGDGDSGKWPFMPGVNCYCNDYTTGEWSYVEDSGFHNNFAMRSIAAPYASTDGIKWINKRKPSDRKTSDLILEACEVPEGYVQGSTPAAFKTIEDRIAYNVYRGINNADTDAIEWTEIEKGTKKREYVDSEWGALPQGVYRYGVKAVYHGGEESSITITDSIGKNMSTELTFRLITDTPENECEGAGLHLVSNDGGKFVYTAQFDNSGKVTIKNVWKNNYTLFIGKQGFSTISEILDLTQENSYSFIFNLPEDRRAPSNLQAIAEGEYDSDRLIVWNFPDLISEGFEDHPDFEINSAGNAGWTYIDGDDAETGAFAGYEWPGQFDRMAFMVFNPSATSPDCTELGIYPYEGNRMLVEFASYGAANDDWIISPKLFFKEDFILSFFASSFDFMAPETIQVGYSESGNEPSDFIWLDDQLMVNGYWTEYSYNIPATARYITIHGISNQCTMLMIDNIRIGIPSMFNQEYMAPFRKPMDEGTYEIFLDGEKVGQTAENTYMLNDIPLGTHSVGVRSVHTSGYSPLSTVSVEVTSSEVSKNISECLRMNVTGRVLKIEGEYSSVKILDASGITVFSESNAKTHNLSLLEKGVYIISADTPEGKITIKAVLK